ncbi:MAG: hypothetical protein RBS56_03105 [Candidatus Gracilibacteria bacterium]|jgi:hypothetical protein|nr:hypothetical protein [Candidatus Gracilibacteria bacterium]
MENKTSKKAEVKKTETASSKPNESKSTHMNANKKNTEFSAEMIKEELSKVSKDGIIEEVKKAVDVISMKDASMKSVSLNQKSEVYGALIFLLPVAVSTLFMFLTTPYFVFSYALYLILIQVLAFASTGFSAMLIADKVFKTKISIRPLFRIFSYASIVTWPMIIPSFFTLLNLYGIARLFSFTRFFILWIFVIQYFYLFNVLKVKQNDAIIISVATGISYYLVLSILGKFFFGSFYGMGFVF